MSADITLSAEKICKHFSYQPHTARVLNALDLHIEHSEFVLLLGSNGAGKSTLLRILAGLMRADSGNIKYGNNLPPSKQLGFLGHALQLYTQLSVKENLALFAKLRQVKLNLHTLLEAWDLKAHATKQISALSRGLKQRAALAAALIHQPNIILLDEPSTALDAQGVLALKKVLAEKHKQNCILLASHDINSWCDTANRVILLDQGKIALDTTELRKLHPNQSLSALKERVVTAYRNGNR